MVIIGGSLIVASAVLVLIVTRADSRRFLHAATTKTSWAKSVGVADDTADTEPSDEITLFIATSGLYAPGYVAVVPLDEPVGNVLVCIADPDSRAGLPMDMEDEGIARTELASYVASWGLRQLSEPHYRDAVLLRHFRNILVET